MRLISYLYFKEKKNIPLTGDELLSVYEEHYDFIDPKEFIRKLLYYRIVFDRFIVKTTDDENSEDFYKWTLQKPSKYYYEKKNQDRLIFSNSFSKQQEAIIKCLSMLQVTFRTKKYKTWLYKVLCWFEDSESLEMSEIDYLNRLNNLVLASYENNDEFNEIYKESLYAKGTHTPHFLFNFIDYLYWCQDSTRFNFEFKYRNSVEHHYPQSNPNESDVTKDSLGNLCLVSRGGNSKMNNEQAQGKAATTGKYYRENLPPKQKIIYEITNSENEWSKTQIQRHYEEVVELINHRKKILDI